VWCEQQPSGWRGEVRGVFRQVDLEQVVTRQFPHKLSGSANLSLQRCRLAAGRITEMTGRLESDGGVVSRSLLDAAEQALGLRQHTRSSDAALLRYQQLDVAFQLDRSGLVLTATLPDRALLRDGHGPLLSQRGEGIRSSVDLVHLLVPRAETQVPATRETAALLRTLPLPRVSMPAATAERASYAPLRFQLR
jgi:hypothetical protein